MDSNTRENSVSHNDAIISQFTKQALPFSQMSQHSNHYGLELMFELSNPQVDDKVLDVACGPGIIACEFAKKVYHVTGIDITPAMIEEAKNLQRERKIDNIDWKLGDVTKLPFEDDYFSMVVTRYSFHHLIEPRQVLEEMERVCKPNGKILIIDVTPDKDKVEAYNHVEKLRDSSHTGALTFDELKGLMDEARLTSLKSKHHELEMRLESILKSSFPNPEDIPRIRQLFQKDISMDNLGMKSHMENGEIFFYFPISMILGTKS
ncbi:MAG: methyltransferase domain-containing protein [Candidatus Nitrosocosmicus sp.]|nr:methyltransferase domain-containing protein [Candidatus Nitrosocosmicus sp.]